MARALLTTALATLALVAVDISAFRASSLRDSAQAFHLWGGTSKPSGNNRRLANSGSLREELAGRTCWGGFSTCLRASDVGGEPVQVTINTTLCDEKIKNLYCWIKRVLVEDPDDDVYANYFNNIELAIMAVFGDNLPSDSLPQKLMEIALSKERRNMNSTEWEEGLVGDEISRTERERSSLGAMGAGQWTGQWMTRPHSLLDIRNFTSVDDWIKTLPRGCKRTLKKATANEQNFTVFSKPIRGGDRAPHSSYQHFRCVVYHEVRLLSNMYGQSPGSFFNALAEAISRYIGTTRQAGNIVEYRDNDSGKVIGFAHEIGKARTFRGQWFYCDDSAATRYVWFHSVKDLVARSIADERIDTVDLGPSGSDAFTELKQKYGFVSVVDWPRFADYQSGGFIYSDDQNERESAGDEFARLIKILTERQTSEGNEKRPS